MFILKRGENMNIELAKELLSFHSCRNDDINNPKWENGFLGSLRPFQGKIYEKNFSIFALLRLGFRSYVKFRHASKRLRANHHERERNG